MPAANASPLPFAHANIAGDVTRYDEGLIREATLRELTSYIYFRRNVAGVQREWWNHRFGCQIWFLAERDTRTNEVLRTELPA